MHHTPRQLKSATVWAPVEEVPIDVAMKEAYASVAWWMDNNPDARLINVVARIYGKDTNLRTREVCVEYYKDD